jgi:5-formyltetrahydrofolate cyclo-ligase
MTVKQRLRTEARARRAGLARSGFAQAIAAFSTALALPKGAIVAGYHPIRDEADPRALMSTLSAQGHPLALPVVTATKGILVFRTWQPGDPLTPNSWGIAEPLAASPQVAPHIVLVPLLAFDATGHRLGYGGGYYDRTLETLAGVRRVGIAYAGQQVSAVPREPHDLVLDAVITENGVHRF